MANEKWRMDLKQDIRGAMERHATSVVIDPMLDDILQAVLSHLEAAYKRGEMAGRSRAGYKIPNPRREGE